MDTLAQLKEAVSDRYAIDREIGAGGMATVYLARDLRHDRLVALKLLNPELGAVLGVERFLAEIKVTANLQHPNLLPLFDSGAAGGHLFYVMPFVEGESLRARLEREKQLPIEDALRIAIAVANALDYAHSHGVIHRDLKPENILLQAGQPMVADFGIALAVSKAGGHRITQTGLSLGTPQYMSPEQATGDRVIDGRSDIYSLAAVTYEMLTGEPPHIGNTAQAIIARVLTDKPRPVRSTRSAVPEHVEAAIDRALTKLPADRFSSAREFAEALQGRGATTAAQGAIGGVGPAGARRSRLRDPVVLGLGVWLLASVAFLGWVLRRPAAESYAAIRFSYGGSDSSVVDAGGFPWPAAISPDGSLLVYFSTGTAGGTTRSLYLRRSDQLAAHMIPGTAGAAQPVFSPDGEWVAFQADGKEKKVRLDGSAPVTIAEGGAANGVDWTVHNELVLGSTGPRRGLSRVSTAGGEPTEFTRPDSTQGDLDHLWPIALPDGKHVVFVIWSGALASARLAITSLEDGTVTPLGLKGVRPLAILDGALVYLQVDGAVMAVPLDVRGRKVAGRPVPVHDPVPVAAANNGNSDIFISPGGALVSARGTFLARLTWVNRDGKTSPVSPEVRAFAAVRLSPDQRRLALLVYDGNASDIWILDLATGTMSRLTTSSNVTSVEWTKDGKGVVYAAGGSESRSGFWYQPVDQATPPTVLFQMGQLSPYVDISPDGRSLLVQSLGTEGWDVLRVALDSSPPIRPFVNTRATDWSPRFSPDGRWVALSSEESGAFEVYVRSFPDPSVKVQVSVGGGVAPAWSADGTRLFYRSGDAFIAARLTTTPTVQVLSRDPMFSGPGFRQTVATYLTNTADYDITRDGQRMVIPVPQSSTYQLVVVPNWLTEFRQRMAASRR